MAPPQTRPAVQGRPLAVGLTTCKAALSGNSTLFIVTESKLNFYCRENTQVPLQVINVKSYATFDFNEKNVACAGISRNFENENVLLWR